MDVKELLQLAKDFNLPCIIREDSLFVIGEKEILEFKTEEKTQWVKMKVQ